MIEKQKARSASSGPFFLPTLPIQFVTLAHWACADIGSTTALHKNHTAWQIAHHQLQAT